MRMYEINQQIEELLMSVDPDTGEWLGDPEKLNDLLIAKDEKLESVALWIKEMDATAKLIREEEKKLAERRTKLTAKAESVKSWLAEQLNGEKFETARCTVSFRKSPVSVTITDMGKVVQWAVDHGYEDLVEYAAPTISKTNVGKIFKEGDVPEGAEQVTDKVSMVIK